MWKNLFSASFAPLALLAEFASEAHFNEVGKTVVEVFDVHVAQNVVDKGMLQEQASFSFGDTALTHVEERALIEFANRRTVVTLHIVGIDFEHRLAVGMGRRCGADVGICLLRLRFLRPFSHIDFACKGTRAMVGKHVLVEHVAVASR